MLAAQSSSTYMPQHPQQVPDPAVKPSTRRSNMLEAALCNHVQWVVCCPDDGQMHHFACSIQCATCPSSRGPGGSCGCQAQCQPICLAFQVFYEVFDEVSIILSASIMLRTCDVQVAAMIVPMRPTESNGKHSVLKGCQAGQAHHTKHQVKTTVLCHMDIWYARCMIWQHICIVIAAVTSSNRLMRHMVQGYHIQGWTGIKTFDLEALDLALDRLQQP